MQSVSIIGIGRLGGALAIALSRAGYRVECLIYRSELGVAEIAGHISPSPYLIHFENLVELQSDIIFITTADQDIASVSSAIAKKIKGAPIVFHTSGSLSAEILETLTETGCRFGSLHPLISISDPIRGGERFAGAYFCVEGDNDSVAAANKIVASLGGNAFPVETKFKTLYHAAAVTSSGHLVALIDVATELLSKCGVERGDAQQILLPLIRSTVENLEFQSTGQALTGPYARGDFSAFERHLDTLSNSDLKDEIQIYLELANRSMDLSDRVNGETDEGRKIRDGIKFALRSCK